MCVDPLPSRLHAPLFAVELAAFAAIFVWDEWVPISKTPFLLAIAWISLRARGVTWRSLGFAAPPAWARTLGIGAGAGTAIFAFEFFAMKPALAAWTGEYSNLSGFASLVGNLPMLLLLLAANFVLAALGEELVWRGYALPRVAELIGGSRAAWVASLVMVNTGFGLAHLYQGPTGVIETGVGGAVLGGLYLAGGRNLVIPMAAHFTSNAIDFVLIYLGRYPGVSQ